MKHAKLKCQDFLFSYVYVKINDLVYVKTLDGIVTIVKENNKVSDNVVFYYFTSMGSYRIKQVNKSSTDKRFDCFKDMHS